MLRGMGETKERIFMNEKKLDLSVEKNALKSMNKTAMVGIYIMNVILAAAYFVEVIKGSRDIVSYAIIAACCVLPCVISFIIYKANPASKAIRYACGGGFALFYGYSMLTTSTKLAFVYVIVIFVMLVVYMDTKFLLMLGVYSVIVNVLVIVIDAVNGKLKDTAITETEIIVACLLLTTVFMILALKKINMINKANIEKADIQKEQSEELLDKTLEVAGYMISSIESAVTEVESLNVAIGETQNAMEELNANTNEAVCAIDEQKQSTEKINGHIKLVENSVDSIVVEVNNTEENIKSSDVVMKGLLEQVKTSENSGNLVVEKMNTLKTCAEQMQSIMGLISSIANQTGMLALNASIEAARAGEAGRGFAVVASEISNLSSQTNQATSDINGLIESIAASVSEVSGSMEMLLESNKKQNDYINDTASNFEKIHNSTEEIVSQVAQLKKLVDQVTEENKRVEENIESVAQVTDKVMNGADSTLESCNTNIESIAKVSAIMDELKTEADKLQNE